MRHIALLTVMLPLVLTACNADDDRDGLSNRDEKKLGTNPEHYDSDGDGLRDGDEVNTYLTDPLGTDSDGDGYDDKSEVEFGSDPVDAASMIYTGGWPYNPTKDEDYGDPGYTGSATAGAKVPRIRAIDQYGEEFDIYDMSGDGKPMVVDLSGLWCGWCHEVAKLIERQPSALDGRGLDCIDELVEEQDIHWVTVIYSDRQGNPATAAHSKEWYDLYPNHYIPVLVDPDQQVYNWFRASGFPAMIRVDTESMTVEVPPGNYSSMLSAMCTEFGAE